MNNKFIYWYLNFASCINSSTIKKILKTTTYIALFTIVFITSWAVPQEKASANSNWQCNDAYARAYFYKLDWDYSSTSFTIDQYVATETTTIQRTTVTVDFSSTSNIAGTVKGINALAMSPTGVMYVTITSDGHGTHLFTINRDSTTSTTATLTPLAHIADYQQVGDNNFYDGVNGYYGFSSGDYVVNANGNDQIYMAQAGFEHGYIYNVATGGVTTYSDPGMVTPINAADFSYIGNWDGYEIATYNALANKVILYDKDNNTISEVTPTNSAFSNVSATLASYSYKTPEGEIRFIIDDGLGNRFEVKRVGTNSYTVETKGTTFTTDNSDGASCGPEAYDPFGPSFKTSLGACASGYQQPSLLITNNRQTTQYFDVQYRISGGSWVDLLNGTELTPGGQFTTDGAPQVYNGQTVEYQMRYGSSNPNSGTYYTVGDLLTGSGCGDYAAGTVSTSAGTCDGGSSTPTVTLTNTGTVTTYFDVQYKIGTGAWVTFIDGEAVSSGTPETISMPVSVVNGQQVHFQYLFANANPTATTGFTAATSRTIDCPTYSATITATPAASCTNDLLYHTVTITNTGNTSMWFGVAERRNIGNSNFQWLDQDIQINGGDSYTWNSRSVYNGVTPEYKMVYGTYRYQYYSTDLHSSGNTEGTFTQRTYGNYLKSGDSWVRWTANSAVDCDWWGNGGYGTNSSSNYTRVSQSTSQICDGSGNATIRLTVTNYNAANDAYAGFIDVQWSTNNTNWVDVVDGRAIADGESITFESPDQIASSSTGYFRYRIAATNPTDSTTNASWAVFSRQANCIADYSQSASFSECSATGQYSTLSITNNESQTLYFRAVPTKNDTPYNYNTTSSSNYDFNSEAITFSVPANSTLTYDASNSPNMRKLYPDGTYGYMQWIVQGSYIESPDWTNTTAYPYKLTNGQIHQCIPDVTASYDVTACSSAGQTSTLTITNNESQTIYFKVNPSKTASTYSTSVSNTYNYNTTDATTFSVAANTTFVYTAGAVTYGVNEDAYMFWRIQKSYTENPTWNTESYPYQYLSSPTSGLSYQHDCDLNVDPYNNGNHQYETRPSNEQNSCVDNKQWMGWVLRNANSTDPNRTSLWYAFEVSIDNGANFNTNNLFYRMDDVYYDNDVFAVTSGSGSLSADGYTAVQATNNLNMSNSSSNQYIYLSTRAVSGSIMKIRYKVAYAENELGSTDWITLGTYSKTIEQRTTDCEPEINTSGWGTATTTDTTNDTFSDIVTIGECQNTIETGGFATSTLTLTRPSGVQYYLKLWQSTDSGSNWTPVETNFAMGTTYTKELTVNHAGKIKYKFQFSYISGDFSNSNTYYSAEKTVNCPTVGASTASIALGTCVSGGATPTITLGNNGWATGYFHVQYSTDLGQNYNDAFYDPNNGNATIYQMILPGEVKTYTIQDTISQGTTVVMQYRFAATSPVSSGSFTTTGTLLIDCSSDVSTVTVEQDTSAEACYNGSQRLKVRYTNSSSSNNYFYYKINKNSQGYDTNWSVATLNANTSNGTVTLPESYGNNDTVLVKYHIESTEGGSYGTEVINNLITIDCGTDDFFTVSTDYVSCNLYGADKLEFKFKRNSTSASFSSNAYLHIEAEISHDGNIWKPLGRMQYSNESTGYWYSSSGTKGNLNDTHPTYHGYIRPYYFSNNEYVAGVILTDSTHQYQIRYRTYTSTTNNLTMGNFTGVFTTITIAPDTNCDQNDIQPVTLTTTQLTCLENKGQVEFTFNDTTVTHLDPYQPARLFYQYSTNGGVTWSTNINQREALSNTATFNLPSVKVTNGTALQIKWGYVRDHTLYSTSTSYHTYHNTYSNSNINARQFDYIGGLTSTGLYYEHYREDDSSNDFNANFMNHNMVNTTTVNVDCDPDSTYSQTLTTCECNDLGATSTLSITNNDNYTSYYKVQYKIGNGQWLSATDSLESAFDISVSGGTTNDSLSKFVPDGETIQWRVKDTTNGGDFDGQEWEEVTASATVDCGCAGGSVDIDITSSTCGNGSSTPIINLIPSSSDTAYFTVQYKRNTDTDWVAFKTEESVTNGQTENHTMQVTVVHQGTIQVRYKVNKILGNLSSQEWNYTDTKTINCPFTAVLGEAIYSSCGTNYRAASFKVTNTSSSTSAAQFRVQYKIVTSSTTVTDWTNSSIIDSVVAPGASLVTTNNLQITEGQKIIWRYESVNSSEDFLNNWTEDDTSGYVNCVINVTVTNAMSSCDAGSQTATLNLTNDESDNTVYFQVHYKTGNSWILKSANLAVSPGDTNRTLTVDVEHTKNIQWKYKVSDTSNDYGNSEEVELAASATVNCPILDATGSSAFGACESGQRKSTFTMINSASANAPAYFYVQYDLSGDNQSWINATQANLVTAGGQNNVHVFVPNGETITWRYYPMTTATTPADNQWIAETTKTPEDCSLDTLISHTLDACISNSQVSRFVLTNNTAGNVYYQVEYFIEGTSAYVVADNDLLLSAGSPQAFTQTVDSGKYIQWRYKAATSQNGLLSAAYVDHVENTEFKKSVNCESIDPSVIQSFGICYNDTKEVKFIIKNSSSATTTAFFKVQYKIGSGEWIDKPDQTIGIGGQYPHSQIVASGQTIQWQYKVAKNQAALPTGWTTLNETTIACSGGEDISVTFDTNCDANGYKTSKLNIFNSSSGTLYYKAEYTFEGASSNNWTVAAEQVVIATGNSTFLPISVQQGQAITWRYKVSETGNDFGSLNWTTSQTSDVVDCTGVSISTPYTSLSQCVSGAKTSTFNYTTLSSSANAAYFHIQYRIDGGTWINKVTSSDGTLAAGQSNAVTQSVTSGTTIEWQYKAAYSSTALTNASFISVAGGAEEVDCGVQLSVSHSFSTCANQTATSTLLLKNTGATPMLVTVQSKLNTGSWATEVSTYEITASNELSLTKTIVSGQTISWKYKYAGTVVKLSSASETTMDTIPALDCETAVLSQVSVNNVLKSCVLGKRISELTFTNNSTETVYVEAWYDTGSGYVLKGTYSVINGTPRVLESPGADHQASVKWKYRLGLSSSVTGNFTELSALTVDCPQTSQVSATLEACTNLTRDSKLNIKNTGSVTQYYQIYYSISNGSYQYLTEISLGAGLENNSSYVNLSSGQYINWKYKTSTVQGDFANSNDNFVTRSATVNCIDDSLSATTSSTCTPNGAISTKTSKFTITNSSADSKQVEVQYSTDNANYLPMGTHTVTNLQPYVDDRIFTTNYFTYRYRILGTTNWSPTVISMAPSDCSTPTNVISAYNTNQCESGSSIAKLTIVNPGQAATVIYDININNEGWQSGGNALVNGTFTSSGVKVPANTSFQWRYKLLSDTTYKFVNDIANNCSPGSSISAITEILCPQDGDGSEKTARLRIINVGSQSASVMYNYKINNGSTVSGSAPVPINPNSSGYSIQVPLNDGDQIVFGYKLTSDTSYQQTPSKSTSECGTGGLNPELIQTISECTQNFAVSTIEMRNLSDQVKTFYLEYRINNGPWVSHDIVTVNASSPATSTLNVTQNSTVQWRALENSYTQFDLNSPYQLSQVETVICDSTTPTTLPPVKYIFEPIVSTNRVCDFEDGGAEFGITVDNSRSNVSAKVLKKIWINTTLIAQETVNVPAGQSVDFSSIEVGENKFFTVALEVTNNENGKVQKMIKNKDADCIEDERPINDGLNPSEEIQASEDIDNVMDGDGDDQEMEDNGESLLFLPGDDFVEFVYNEDADNPFVPQFTDESPPTPGIPFTGRNVGGFIISFGLLLMGLGAFILRRAY